MGFIISFILGEISGEKTHTLSINEMPSHKHKGISWYGSTALTIDPGSSGFLPQGQWGGGSSTSNFETGNTGGGQAHNNLSPYAAVNFIISY